MRTKSFRIENKERVLLKRTKKVWHWFSNKRWSTFLEEVKSGKHSWLRTTGKPCSCSICTQKYNRKIKHKDSLIED